MRLRNYVENWKSHERLSDKSMSSRPRSLEIKESLGSHEECCKVFLEKTVRHRLRIHGNTRKPFLGKQNFLF